MSLTNEAVSALRAKVEPRKPGVTTQTGLTKVGDGSLYARPSTKYGFRTEEETEEAIQQDADMVAELQTLRNQATDEEAPKPKKRTRKKAAEPVQAASQPAVKQITVTVKGFGGIPSQYANVNIGEGIALLGLTQMSFIPQISDPSGDEPTNLLELSVAPEMHWIYMGNTVTLDNKIKQLVLIEVPEGD